MYPEVPEMPQPGDEWCNLHRAACAAGQRAAQQLTQRCSNWQLGRAGHVHVHIEPADSPVADWLYQHDHATHTTASTLVCIGLSPRDVAPDPPQAGESASLLVSYAYAAAYRTVLTEEAGVAIELTLAAHRSRSRGQGRRCPHTRLAHQLPAEAELATSEAELATSETELATSETG